VDSLAWALLETVAASAGDATATVKIRRTDAGEMASATLWSGTPSAFAMPATGRGNGTGVGRRYEGVRHAYAWGVDIWAGTHG